MSQFLNIFARSTQSWGATRVDDLVDEIWYGDEPVAVRRHGQGVTLALPGRSQPVTISSEDDPEALGTLVAEQLSERPDVPEPLAELLRAARQVVTFEISGSALDEDGWELIHVLLSVLAGQLDGVIVTDDGIYDPRLKKLAE